MRSERGISLLEIVVAVTIIAVVMLFLSRGFLQSMFMTRQSDEYAAAARAARDKMEEIVSQTYRQYDRVETPVNSGNFALQIDPRTGQYKTTLRYAIFNDIPTILRIEFVGGRRINSTVNIPVTQQFKSPVTSGWDIDPFGRLHPFKVYLSDLDPDNPDSTRGLLPGLVDDYAGEVVIVNSERLENWAANTATDVDPGNNAHVRGVGTYGGDLLPRDGVADGFDFFRLPIDLNGDGDFNDDVRALGGNQLVNRYAVGVIVRWNGRYGPERHETWTIISRN